MFKLIKRLFTIVDAYTKKHKDKLWVKIKIFQVNDDGE